MFRIFAIVLSLMLASHTARADGFDVLFNGHQEWLNAARPVTKDDAKGRAVLLDFWTYGCINCMQVVPDLKSLEGQFGDKLLVIGVHSAKFTGEQGSDRILAAAKRFGITHPVVNDSSFAVWTAFSVDAWPTLVLLGPDGKEVNRYAGEGHKDEIASDIAKAMANAPAPAPLTGLKKTDVDTAVLSFPARLGFAETTPWDEIIFTADTGHNRILGFDIKGNVKVVIGAGSEGAADGDFAKATFNHPRGFAITRDGLYVADTGNHELRYVDFKARSVTRVAGTGERGTDRNALGDNALTTALASPWDAKIMPDGKTVVIACAGLHQLWTYDPDKKTVSVLAGTGEEDIRDGKASEAALAQPSGLSVMNGNVYFVDAETSSLRVLDGAANVKTLIGKGLFDFGIVDGEYPKALMQHAQGLDVQGDHVYVADTYNNALRLYGLDDHMLSTIKLPKGSLSEPGDVMALNGKLFVADSTHNRIAVVDAKAGTVEPLTLTLPKN